VLIGASLASLPAAAQVRASRPGERSSSFDTKKAGFSLKYSGEVGSYRDLSTFVLPGTTLVVEASGPPGAYTFAADGAPPTPGTRSWHWRAPEGAGVHELRVEGPISKTASAREAITLRVFVMVPASQIRNGSLNGFPIGEYPARPLHGLAIYQPPPGFVEVTRDNQDVRLSPHFRLKQFLCKQEKERPFPQYLVLKERLVLALEAILERVNTLGFDVDGLHVMSAYRTPLYNHAIGDVLFSQHQWGSAADIYLDKDNRNRMDDLNHDGKVDIDDAKYLADIVDELTADPAYAKFTGGIGFYPGTAAHPPFVHVDVRGSKARWRG
jgi:hypothetical protein